MKKSKYVFDFETEGNVLAFLAENLCKFFKDKKEIVRSDGKPDSVSNEDAEV